MKVNGKFLWMVCGAVLLAGCQDEVMKPRGYVPADDPAVRDKTTVSEVAPNQPEVSDRTADTGRTEEVQPAQTKTAPAPAEQPRQAGYPMMTGKFDNSGVSSDEAEAGPGEYIVRSGDTLGKIAVDHRVKLAALMKANNLNEKSAKRLRVGQKLVIPGGKAAKNAKGGVRPSGKKAPVSGKASIQPGEYIVKAGDTPERIARRANIRLAELMAANKLTEDGARRLRIGQKLVIPGAGKKTAAAKPAAKPVVKTAVAKPAVKKGTTAEPGKDQTSTGSETAAQTDAGTEKTPVSTPGSASDDSALLNDMQNAPAAAGTEQPAPAPGAAPAAADNGGVAEVTENISIADFAKKHNTTPEALRTANPDLSRNDGDIIKKGEVLLLPR